MICRIGAAAPLALTVLETIVILGLGVLSHTYTFHWELYFALGAVIAIGLGFSLLNMFSRIWAMVCSATVSLLWLGLGVQTWYDAATHPEKYSSGDGAYAVILLVPFGFIGVLSWAVLFWNEWRIRHYSPRISDNRSTYRIVP
jgi:hypothetical protein